MEVDLVHHCNLRCAHCSVASGFLPKYTYPFDVFQRDVLALSEAIGVKQLRFVGGEPLLCKNIADYAKYVKSIGMCQEVAVVTNAVLLDTVDEEVFKTFDVMTLSFYTSMGHELCMRTSKAIDNLLAIAPTKYPHLKVEAFATNHFMTTEIDFKIEDDRVVQKIWDDCWLKNTCTSISDGFVHRCTCGKRKGLYLKEIGVEAEHLLDPNTDGCSIHEPNLKERLGAYLKGEVPLKACDYCLGASGKLVEQTQHSRQYIQLKVPEKKSIYDLVSFTEADL